MNSYTKSALKLSIATVLGVVASNAMAVVDLTGATGTTKVATVFAKENPVSSTATTTLLNAAQVAVSLTATGPLVAKIPFVPGYSVNSANFYYVKLALTGGAKFGTQPELVCATGLGGAGSDSGAAAVTVGGVGTNAVTLQLPSGVILATGGANVATGCIVSLSSLIVSGAGDVNISGTIEYKDGANNVATALTGPFVTFKKGLSATVSADAAAAVIDVTTGSKKFVTGGVVSALAGSVSYKVSDATATYTITGAELTASITAGAAFVSGTNGFSVTIAGPAVGAAATAYLASPTCATPLYIATPASGASVTITGVTATDISAGLLVCLGFDGTKAISEGQITAAIAKNGTETISTNPDFSVASNNMYKFTKNGATVNVNFLTNPAGFQTFVRFTNPTSFDGNVLVTAINDDGAVGPNTWSFTLPKNGSQMYSVTTIMSKTGVVASTVTPADGLIGNKFRLVINADTSALNVQSLNLSKDGNSFGQLTDK
jgi:hypothetical protein